MEEKEPQFKFCSEEEIRKIIKSKEKLYFADDGIDEVIVKAKDIPDFIVDVNIKCGSTDFKFYRVGNDVYEPEITTMGMFLDKIKPEIREKIINRLVKLQTGEIEPKDYKLIDENQFEDIQEKMKQEKSNKKKNKERAR